MPLPTDITQLSTTAALNYPSGSDSPSVLDDVLRQHAVFIAQLRDGRASAGLNAAVATTSGTFFDVTGVPSWATKIYVKFIGVSTTGASNLIVQIGDAGGIETTGYVSTGTIVQDAVATAATLYTTGFGIRSSSAGNEIHGVLLLILADAATNAWTASGNYSFTVAALAATAGSKSLSSTLTRLRIGTVGGTDTFDAGKFAVSWE